jgi:hypothetical protein
MKIIHQLTLVLFVITLTSLSVYAQQYSPSEQKVQLGKATANAWVVTIDDEPLDALKKSWSGYVKQELDVKSKKDGRDGLIAKEILSPRLYAHKGDLKAKFFTENSNSTIAVAFMPGYDISLNTQDHPEEAENLRVFTKNFVKYYKTNQLNRLIAKEEKRESTIESAYKKNESERKKLTKHVAKLDKQLTSDKTEEVKKLDLKNQKISDESRIDALQKIMANQKSELTQINRQIQQRRADISQLERLFAEKVAEQQVPSEQ